MDKVNLFALYIGLFAGVIFLLVAFTRKNTRRPELNHLVVVVLATTGAMVGVHLGYLVLTLEDNALGELSSQRIPIALGALAVIWTSVETLVNTFKMILPISSTDEDEHNKSN